MLATFVLTFVDLCVEKILDQQRQYTRSNLGNKKTVQGEHRRKNHFADGMAVKKPAGAGCWCVQMLMNLDNALSRKIPLFFFEALPSFFQVSSLE